MRMGTLADYRLGLVQRIDALFTYMGITRYIAHRFCT